MKLAQALAERAAVQTRLDELSGRLAASALVQEGERPVEEPSVLLAEAEHCFDRLTRLVSAINATNAATEFEPGVTVTAAIARRDTLARRRQFLSAAAQAATPGNRMGRSEIKFVPTLDVAALRKQADEAAQAYRQLDDRLQALNWSVDLIES